MDPISLFLERDILPEEKSETEKVRRKASQFWLSEDRKLYKRSFSDPYLHCVHPEVSESLLEEFTRKDLWESHRRKILISLGYYSGILVARHAKGGTGICQEM